MNPPEFDQFAANYSQLHRPYIAITGEAPEYFVACKMRDFTQITRVNFSRHRISNSCAEGFNSAIQLIKANARSLTNFTNYRTRILFHCGKREMGPG